MPLATYWQEQFLNINDMPPSKNAFIRYRIIDQCLRDQEHKWSKKDILNKVNKHLEGRWGYTVTESSIRHDLDDIELYFDKEIDRYPGKKPVYYRYKNPEDSLFFTPLSEEEIAKITHAMELLASVKGLELDEELPAAIAALQNRTQMHQNGNKKVMYFDHQPFATGSQYVLDFLTSIQQQTPLKIEYRPFTENVSKIHHFHSYLLKEFNSRWFCIGYCSMEKKVITLGLDRIIDTPQLLKQKYIENTFFNPDSYFEDIIGVTRPENTPKVFIRLEFSAARFPYVQTKPIHHSQQIEKHYATGKGIVTMELIPNKELTAVLLSFGKDVKVLEPSTLAVNIESELNKALSHYNPT
jgi:predicted DNA-binding transcriptional regulator YafY